MTSLFLYDDARARTFEPFALTRPACELRAGALLLRERWERALQRKAVGVVTSSHLADFEETWGVPVVDGRLPKGSIIANSRCAVSLASLASLGEASAWVCDGRLAAITLSRDIDASELHDGSMTLERLAGESAKSMPTGGRWIDNIWDFIGYLTPMLVEDITALTTRELGHVRPSEGMKHGDHPVLAEPGAHVEPQVYFDTTGGPVLVRRGATVMAFTRIVGPCVIGEGSQVGGDKIANVSIGDVCKVHGEVSSTIFLGHSNKGHEGFVGHSYLGRWVNLGAGTTTSNLKNTYGNVLLWTPEGDQNTRQQFLGTFFGDHAKTGIGLMLTTGTVLGAGANVYGGEIPPKAVPPFCWGEHTPFDTYHLEKFLDVAKKMMQRRHVELSPKQARQLRAAFERRWSVKA